MAFAINFILLFYKVIGDFINFLFECDVDVLICSLNTLFLHYRLKRELTFLYLVIYFHHYLPFVPFLNYYLVIFFSHPVSKNYKEIIKNPSMTVCVKVTGEDSDDVDPWTRREEDEDEGVVEYFVLQESSGYMAPTLRFLAVMHTVISFLCVLGYYYLKVGDYPQTLAQSS